MDELIEVLTQIQDLAGVAIEALSDAAGGASTPEVPPAPEGGQPPTPEGGTPPAPPQP